MLVLCMSAKEYRIGQQQKVDKPYLTMSASFLQLFLGVLPSSRAEPVVGRVRPGDCRGRQRHPGAGRGRGRHDAGARAVPRRPLQGLWRGGGWLWPRRGLCVHRARASQPPLGGKRARDPRRLCSEPGREVQLLDRPPWTFATCAGGSGHGSGEHADHRVRGHARHWHAAGRPHRDGRPAQGGLEIFRFRIICANSIFGHSG